MIAMTAMTATMKTQVTVTLTLTAEEAWWLKSYMQNPMGNLVEEEPETAEKRGSIFSSLENAEDTAFYATAISLRQ